MPQYGRSSKLTADEDAGLNAHLETYLNDHLAVLTAGHELARRCHSSNPAEPLGPLLGQLEAALAEDRTAVQALLAQQDGQESTLKQAAGWLAERLGRLKLNDALLSYSDLSRVVELEGLLLVNQSRQQLWQALALGEPLPGLTPPTRLADIQAQQQALQQHWQQAVRQALDNRSPHETHRHPHP